MKVYVTKDKSFKRSGMNEEYKAFIKQIKEAFTDNDLVSLYQEAFPRDSEEVKELGYMDILLAEVEVFGDYKVSADVTVWLKRWSTVIQLNYYLNENLGVDKGKNLHSLTVFKRP